MVAAARERVARKAPGDEPERTCIVTRAKLAPDALIRFVRGPDGQIVPDIACRLPGRGVWVAARKASVAEAARRNPFSRALKAPVVVDPGLADLVEDLLKRRVAGALGLAVKAGQALAGFTKVEKTLDRGEAVALVHASDAAEDGKSKLDRKFHVLRRDLGLAGDDPVVTELSSDELSLAMGRSHVVHAALTKGGAADSFLKEAGRLRRYRTDWHVAAAEPQAPASDTEQA